MSEGQKQMLVFYQYLFLVLGLTARKNKWVRNVFLITALICGITAYVL